MKRRKTSTNERIKIPSFWGMVGLRFPRGGFAEVVMSWSEFSYLLQAWKDYELARTRRDERVLSALAVLENKVHKMNAVFVAEVPIAQRRARITPTFDDET